MDQAAGPQPCKHGHRAVWQHVVMVQLVLLLTVHHARQPDLQAHGRIHHGQPVLLSLVNAVSAHFSTEVLA